MKKIILIISITSISLFSCKKENINTAKRSELSATSQSVIITDIKYHIIKTEVKRDTIITTYDNGFKLYVVINPRDINIVSLILKYNDKSESAIGKRTLNATGYLWEIISPKGSVYQSVQTNLDITMMSDITYVNPFPYHILISNIDDRTVLGCIMHTNILCGGSIGCAIWSGFSFWGIQIGIGITCIIKH